MHVGLKQEVPQVNSGFPIIIAGTKVVITSTVVGMMCSCS